MNTYEDILYLREASNCPPDVPLKDWLILLSDFFDKYEGGQTISLLEEENKKLEKEVKELEKKIYTLTYDDGSMFGRGKYE